MCDPEVLTANPRRCDLCLPFLFHLPCRWDTIFYLGRDAAVS